MAISKIEILKKLKEYLNRPEYSYMLKLPKKDFINELIIKDLQTGYIGTDLLLDLSTSGSMTFENVSTYQRAICEIYGEEEVFRATKSIPVAYYYYNHFDKQLEEYVIPEYVEKIGDFAFLWSTLPGVKMHNNINYIGDQAFRYTHIKTLRLPENAVLGQAVIDNCNILAELIVPEKLNTKQVMNYIGKPQDTKVSTY